MPAPDTHPRPHTPKVSFGIPVRNGMPGLRLTIESILSQDYTDLEVVVCDNGSTDGTLDYLRGLSQQDPRVKLFPNETNIGQNPNFNRVFEKSTGEYFRWIGVDDVLHPGYVSRCVEALDSHPEMQAVSTDTRFVDDAGNVLFKPFHGERVESPRPERRFARTMWFLLSDYRYFDPMYNMARRSLLAQTECLRPVPYPDQALAAQTSLIGPVLHLPECLSTRQREPAYFHDERALAAKYYPPNPGAVIGGPWRTAWHFARLAWVANGLNLLQRLSCTWSAAQYAIKRQARDTNWKVRGAAKTGLRTLGLYKR